MDKIMSDKIYITWQEFHQQVKFLAQKIKQENISISQIVAISRGGLIPAGILSYELGIRNCNLINMSSYDGETRRNDTDVFIANTLPDIKEDTLIVDDLSDSGRTFNILRELYPNARYACVYTKPKGIKSTDIYAQELPDKWVVFPWD